MKMDFHPDNLNFCFMCLSKFSNGWRKERRISFLIKLITDESDTFLSVGDHEDEDEGGEGVVLCTNCEQLIDSLTIFSNSIFHLKRRLRNTIANILEIVTEAEMNDGMPDKVKRQRGYFVDRLNNKENTPTCESRKSVDVDDHKEPKIEAVSPQRSPQRCPMLPVPVKVKLEDGKDEDSHHYEDTEVTEPSSLSPYILHPDDDDEIEVLGERSLKKKDSDIQKELEAFNQIFGLGPGPIEKGDSSDSLKQLEEIDSNEKGYSEYSDNEEELEELDPNENEDSDNEEELEELDPNEEELEELDPNEKEDSEGSEKQLEKLPLPKYKKKPKKECKSPPVTKPTRRSNRSTSNSKPNYGPDSNVKQEVEQRRKSKSRKRKAPKPELESEPEPTDDEEMVEIEQPKSKTPKKRKRSQFESSKECPACSQKFDKPQKMILHLFKNHETNDKIDKPFSCEKCDKKFAIEFSFQRHLELHNKELQRPMVCEFCDYRFRNQEKLENHYKLHKGYPCGMCPKICATDVSLARHRRTHTGETPYECGICKESFIDGRTRLVHIERVHQKMEYPCQFCEKKFNNRYGLRIHLDKHEQRGRFRDVRCDEPGCRAVFNNQPSLSSHKVIKHGKDPFVCEECGAKLSSARVLKNHKLLKHIRNKSHKCTKCDAAFTTASGLKNHSVRHSNERPFVCSFCGNSFKRRSVLAIHEKIHSNGYAVERKFQCTHCDKAFQYKHLMQGHVRLAHTGEKPFICQISSCGEKFAVKALLTHHMKSHGIFPDSATERAPRSTRSTTRSSRSPTRTPGSNSNRRVGRPRTKQETKKKPVMLSSSETSNSSSSNSSDFEVPLSKKVPVIVAGFSGPSNYPTSSNILSTFANQLHNYQNL